MITDLRNPEAFAAMERLVDRYCMLQAHRPGYASWRNIRIHQENHQSGALKTLQTLFGDRLSSLKILDIGSGMGGYPVALRLNSIACDGIEFNPDYVEISRLRAEAYGLMPMVKQGAIESLPVAHESYDVIHCHDVLEHVQDPFKGLQEMYRVLKPGGTALVTFINRWALKDPHYHQWFVNWMPRKWGAALAHRVFRKDHSLYHDRQRLDEMHYFSVWRARQAVQAAGFTQIKNVRRIKIQAALEKRFSFLAKSPFTWLIQGATALFALREYMSGQNYYWMLVRR